MLTHSNSSSILPAALRLELTAAVFAVVSVALPAQTVFSASGSSASAIQSTVDSFRTELGALNANNGSANASGRREINWDAVPDASSSPNAFSGTFFAQAFNGTNGGRTRGAVFTTPSGGFLVSPNNPGPASSNALFVQSLANSSVVLPAFSNDQIFLAQNSVITDVTFTVPGTATESAFVRGFGAVFMDVEAANTTSFEFFDPVGTSLGLYHAAISGAGGMSFLGVAFGSETAVGRVRITAGSEAFGAFADGSALRESLGDLVGMDDFIYSEPQSMSAIPEPSTYAAIFGGLSLVGVMIQRRRRQTAPASVVG